MKELTSAVGEIDRYLLEVLSTDYGRCSRCGAQQAVGFVVGDEPSDFHRAYERLRACGWHIAADHSSALCARCVSMS